MLPEIIYHFFNYSVKSPFPRNDYVVKNQSFADISNSNVNFFYAIVIGNVADLNKSIFKIKILCIYANLGLQIQKL